MNRLHTFKKEVHLDFIDRDEHFYLKKFFKNNLRKIFFFSHFIILSLFSHKSLAQCPTTATKISQSTISVYSYDSQEISAENGYATNVLDGNSATIWHTRYSGTVAPMPHYIDFDLGSTKSVSALYYLPRQVGVNGRIANFQVFVSNNPSSWGTAVASGSWINSSTEQSISFTPVSGRYVRLLATSEVNGNPWTTAAEINIYECICTPPSITSTTPGSRCGTGTVTLAASASSGTINWYSAASGGTSLFTGTSFTTPSISTTTTYYIDATSSGCTSTPRTAVIATVSCNEVCTNGIDDDGDGLIDCADPDCGMIANREFNNGSTGWNFGLNTSGGANATFNVDNTSQVSGTNSARVVVSSIGTEIWHVQLEHPNINIVAGKRYEISFQAKASTNTNMVFNIDDADPAYNTSLFATAALTTTTKTFNYSFVAQYGDVNSRISFNLGGAVGTYYIDNVVVKLACLQPDICGNNIDENGNGTTDCLDPACLQMIQNGNFDQGISGWELWLQPGGNTATFVQNTASQITGANSGQINITSSTGTNWHVQVAQTGMSIVAGKKYKVSFKAKGSVAGSISVMYQLNQDPWTNYFYNTVNIGTSTQSYNFEFVASSSISNGSLVFNLGSYIGTLYIDDVLMSLDCAVPEICNNGLDDDGDGLIDAADTDCLTSCPSPTFNFASPTLVSGTAGANGAIYRFSNVIPGVDGRLTILSRSHSDIEVLTVDEPVASYGGYEGAIQPIIDYNFVNNPGFDPAGDKSVNFRLNFVKAGTTIDTILSVLTLTSLDVDGSDEPNEIREFFSSSAYNSYATQTGSVLSLSGSLKALGPITTYPNISENALDVMITYSFAGKNQIDFTYGANYGGSTTLADGALPNTDEKRLNSLFLKCYNLNNQVCTGVSSPSGVNASRCDAGTLTLGATGCPYGNVLWYAASSGGSPIAVGNSYTTPVISSTTTYFIECEISGCKSTPRVPVTASITTPVISNTTPGSRCGTGTVTLSATPSYGTVNWYSVATGGTIIFTGTTFVTPSISTTTTYYAEASGSGCTSPTRTAVVASVNSCVGFSCPSGSCETPTLVVNGTFDTNLNNWTATNGELSVGTGGPFGNFMVLNNPDFTNNYSVYQDVAFGPNEPYKFTGLAAKHGTGTNSRVFLEFYNGNTYISKTTDFMVTHDYNNTFQTITPFEGITPANTTKIRIVGFCNGTALKVDNLSLVGCTSISANAGSDQTQCGNNVFPISANTPGAGQSGTWTVVSGNATIANASSPTTTATVTSGSTATLRWTVSGAGGTSLQTHISPTTDGGFENGNTFALNGWTVVNHSTNNWYVGTVSTPSAGSNAAYISNNGGSAYAFTNTVSQTSHFYKDISYPAGSSNLSLSFKWKCSGESGYDRILVYKSPTTFTPSAGSPASSSTASGATLISTVNLHSSTSYQTATIPITETPGTTFRLIFTWQNDNSAGTNPPPSIDEISLTSNGVGVCSAIDDVVLNFNSAPTASISGTNSICAGSNSVFTASGGGTYLWNTSATTAAITVSTAGTYTVTVSSGPGCSATATRTLTVNPIPTITSVTSMGRCGAGSVTLSAAASSGTINWYTTSTGGTSIHTGTSYTTPSLSVTTIYYVDATAAGCTTASRTPVTATISSSLNLSINYNNNVCLTDTSKLTAVVSGGAAPYTYAWTGPSGFTGNTATVNITLNGNYYLTVTDNSGCSANVSGFVYQRYEPFIVNLSTEVCEGQPVTLEVNSPTAVSYQWSANAGSVTTASAVVYPAHPSSTYLVTVTNNLGCKAVPQIVVTAKQKPTVNISGSNAICVGLTTNLTATPAAAGTWTSSNPAVATINSSGVVTGVSAGTATFTFTNTATGCTSNASAPVTIHPKSPVSITGPNSICKNSTTSLSPTSGGTWVSTNPSVATVNNSGLVTGVNQGTARFIFTNSQGCASDTTAVVTVSDNTAPVINGPSQVCVNQNITLTASGSGTWSSSNNTIATINSSGVLTGVSQGSVIITYTHSSGACNNESTKAIMVYPVPTASVTGSNTICVGSTTILSPTSGGTWTSSNPAVATVSNSGIVTGLSNGVVTFTFTSTQGCVSNVTAPVTIISKPTITLTGPSQVCVGSQTTFTPVSGGNWVSSNTAIASIAPNGIVTAISAGVVKFIFTSSNGCVSDSSVNITINSKPNLAIDFHGSVCLTDTSRLTAIVTQGNPNYTFVWTGPSSFTGNTQTININTNGNYYVTVTDSKSCTANTVAFVYQRYEPFITTLNTTVCDGQTINLNVNAPNAVSYLWSSNAGSATTNTVTVTPAIPSSTYTVTVTNNLGCKVAVSSTITVNPKPVVTITGPTSICIGTTSTATASGTGTWSSSNPSVASINSSGVITGLSAGTATFTFTNSTTGCVSNASTQITVGNSITLGIQGPSGICIGGNTQLTPSSGGTWTSNHPAIASVSSAGLVTGLSPGFATFSFTSSQGCTSSGTVSVAVYTKPATLLSGSASICIGAQTNFLPNSGGTWASNHPAIASITNSGVVTALSVGTATFRFTDNAGCASDSTVAITVVPPPPVSITGANSICVGQTTTLSPSSGGVWTSSNTSIASVTNQGIVTGVNPGQATFVFLNTTTGCISQSTLPVTIKSRPVISLTGPPEICIGTTTTLTSPSAGSWSSNNPTVATINSSGIVTGLAAGTASFILTDATTGCTSNNSPTITVYGKPIISISGPTSICIGNITNIIPASGGTWSSSNPTVASISNLGLVTGLAEGTATFTFTQTGSGCISDPSGTITVTPRPIVSITGDNNLCEGDTSSLSPTSGGTWTSTNTAIATVTNSGIITAVSNGTVRFRFTNTQGCQSELTAPITVVAKPSINITGAGSVCIGGTTTLSASSIGTWVSGNPAIATINNSGIVTGVSPGQVRFLFTDTASGCKSDSSNFVNVNPYPDILLLGPSNICIGSTTNVVPTVGGIWSSTNPLVAVVNNAGLVTGLTVGNAVLNYTNFSTGCTSQNGISITVLPRPDVSISDAEICVGATTTLSPSTGGTWTSQNSGIASTTPTGLVTGVNQGLVRFTFTSALTGCTSTTPNLIVVNPIPPIQINGPATICIGNTTQLIPNSGGTWVSLNPSVATIDNNGTVTAVGAGVATFRFTDSATGCQSPPSPPVTVSSPINAVVTGPTLVCIGYTTTLSPSSGGFWTSLRPDVATVSTDGVVSGVAPGKVSFYFTESSTGCRSYLHANAVTIRTCIDPDFGVTAKNSLLQGDLSTNDDGSGIKVYTSPYIISRPTGSTSVLTINPNGTYNFTGDTEGKYIYHVPVCILPETFGCPVSLLEITVVDPYNVNKGFVANVDFGTVYRSGTPNPDSTIAVKVAKNDKCINNITCNLSALLPTPTNPGKGTITNDYQNTGFVYKPTINKIGLDTIYYTLCRPSTSICDNTRAIITINDTSAINSVVAVDDFYATPRDQAISGNVLENDSDPEKNSISVTPLGSVATPINTSSGSYYIQSNGVFNFTPAPGFYGNVHIPYTVCDNNSSQACTKATLQILVSDHLRLNIRVYLEGALMDNNNAKGSDNRPLMRDNLRVNPFTGNNEIPSVDPYSTPTVNIDIVDNYTKVGPGLIPAYTTITNPAAVFSVSGENAIVDWVFVELRSKQNNALVLATRSGLLQRDGDIVDLNGVDGLAFPGVYLDSFYVVIRHRNHLGIMSMTVSNNQLVDLTKPTSPIYDFGTTKNNGFNYAGLALKNELALGVMMMWAGDFDADGKIKFVNPGDDQNVLYLNVLNHPDNVDYKSNFNNGFGYYQSDFNMNGKIKYDNPDDDKNLLYLQILFHPLNLNFMANFSHIIQQVPTSQY